MGMADAATVLFTKFLKFDPSAPDWPDRDRFVLSAGHGSMLLYALLYLTGYDGIGMEDIKRFRQLGSPCAGHPEYGHAPGIETTTGPLGQGLGNSVGFALGERIMNANFGDAQVKRPRPPRLSAAHRRSGDRETGRPDDREPSTDQVPAARHLTEERDRFVDTVVDIHRTPVDDLPAEIC
jgi:hypothetical protein